jgi:hypothetical protein
VVKDCPSYVQYFHSYYSDPSHCSLLEAQFSLSRIFDWSLSIFLSFNNIENRHYSPCSPNACHYYSVYVLPLHAYFGGRHMEKVRQMPFRVSNTIILCIIRKFLLLQGFVAWNTNEWRAERKAKCQIIIARRSSTTT